MSTVQTSGVVGGLFSASGSPLIYSSVELAGQIIGSSTLNGYIQPFFVPVGGLIVGASHITGMVETPVSARGDVTTTSNILGNLTVHKEDSIGLFVSGPLPYSGQTLLTIWGHDDSDKYLTHYINGCLRGTLNQPLYINGVTDTDKELTLYLNATFKYNSDISLYINGVMEVDKAITLFMHSAYNGVVNSIPLYLYNLYADGSFPLCIRGNGTLNNGQLYGTGLTLFMNREGNESFAGTLPLFLQTITNTLNTYTSLFLLSSIGQNGNIPLAIPSIYHTKGSGLRLYTHGF